MAQIKALFFGALITLGLIFTFLVPPFQKPDENRHYYQIEAISRGTLNCPSDKEGIYLPLPEDVDNFPASLKTNEVAHNYQNKFERSLLGSYPYEHTVTVRERNWCSPSIIGYLTNLPGIFIGRLFNSKLASVYLSRLSALIFFLIVFFYSLKHTPKSLQSWLYLYAFTPMVLHQVTAISYDSLILTLIPLIFSYLVSSPPQPYLLWGLLGAISSTKVAYAPLMLLGLINNRKYIWKFVIVALIITLFLIRLPAPHFSEYPSLIDPSAQFQIILRDPGHFFYATINTLNFKSDEILNSFIGQFGWLDYQMHDIYYYLYFSIFLYLVLSSKIPLLPSGSIFYLLISIFLTAGAIFTSLYLYWTQPGFNFVNGIQGRYFLPLLPFVMLIISWLWQQYRPKLTLLFFLIMPFYLTCLIYHRYYDYSHYGQNDLTPVLTPNRVGDHYLLTIPGSRAKLIGFYYYANDQLPPARYTVYDSSCQKILRTGYLQNIQASPQGLRQESFKPVWITSNTCLTVTPLVPQTFPTDAISPLYLIPSLTP